MYNVAALAPVFMELSSNPKADVLQTEPNTSTEKVWE